MTIQERKHKSQLKLVGAKQLCDLFNAARYFCCGVLFISVLPIWESKNIGMIFLFSFLVLVFICNLLYKLFSKTMDEALKELSEIDKLNQWVSNSN